MEAVVLMMITAISAGVDSSSIVVNTDIFPPRFETPPSWPDRSYYDEDGPPISLTCRLTSLDGVTLLWYKGDVLLGVGENTVISNSNQTVTLEIPTQSQTGTYKCRASNQAGSVNHTGYIFIADRKQETRPRVVKTEPAGQVIHADVSGNVTISCVFDVGGTDIALMDLTNIWFKNGTALQDNNHTGFGINVTQDMNQLFLLTIANLQPEDYGIYTCYGENRLGNDSKKISVTSPDPQIGHQPVAYIVFGSVGGFCVVGIVVMVTLFLRRRRQWNKYEELEWLEPEVGNFQVPDVKVVYDVFISYSSHDLKWVKDALFDNLVARGYSVCIDFKDFTPGMPISENIIDAIYKSRHTIVLLSKNFLRSMWGQFELQQAHNRALMQRSDLLILVKYDKSKVPVSLMGKTFLDWSDKKVQPHFWQRLYEAIGEPTDYENQPPDIQNNADGVKWDNGDDGILPDDINHPDVNTDADEDAEEIEQANQKDKEFQENELHDSGIENELPIETMTNEDDTTKREGSEENLKKNETKTAIQERNAFEREGVFVEIARSRKELGKLDDCQDEMIEDNSLSQCKDEQADISVDIDHIVDVHWALHCSQEYK